MGSIFRDLGIDPLKVEFPPSAPSQPETGGRRWI